MEHPWIETWLQRENDELLYAADAIEAQVALGDPRDFPTFRARLLLEVESFRDDTRQYSEEDILSWVASAFVPTT